MAIVTETDGVSNRAVNFSDWSIMFGARILEQTIELLKCKTLKKFFCNVISWNNL